MRLLLLVLGGTDFASLLAPIRRSTWVACDGAQRGTVLIEGASINVYLKINLDSPRALTFEAASRDPTGI